jgi:hypothetical protein
MNHLVSTYFHPAATSYLSRPNSLLIKLCDAVYASGTPRIAVKINALRTMSEVYICTLNGDRGMEVVEYVEKTLASMRETVFINQFWEGQNPRYVQSRVSVTNRE